MSTQSFHFPHRRHRMVLRDNIQGITKPAIRRLARRGGVKRISGLIYEETRSLLRIFLESLVHDAVVFASYARRKTVTPMDVVYACKSRACPLYGVGFAWPVGPVSKTTKAVARLHSPLVSAVVHAPSSSVTSYPTTPGSIPGSYSSEDKPIGPPKPAYVSCPFDLNVDDGDTTEGWDEEEEEVKVELVVDESPNHRITENNQVFASGSSISSISSEF
jgi:histone H4